MDPADWKDRYPPALGLADAYAGAAGRFRLYVSHGYCAGASAGGRAARRVERSVCRGGRGVRGGNESLANLVQQWTDTADSWHDPADGACHLAVAMTAEPALEAELDAILEQLEWDAGPQPCRGRAGVVCRDVARRAGAPRPPAVFCSAPDRRWWPGPGSWCYSRRRR